MLQYNPHFGYLIINLDSEEQSANISNSKEVVKICTQYAQKGMWNIFIALFSFALALAFLSAPLRENLHPVSFFVSYLIAIAVFGLFQAVFMANAGGCWDNAKKIVEVDLAEKGTPLHDATVVGVVFLIIALAFVWRTFYAMRIPEKKD